MSKGDKLGVLASDAGADDGSAGTVAKSQLQLVQSRLGSVVAPADGTAHVSATEVRIDNSGLDVVVPLKPLQELRYRGLRFSGEATVETVLGQRDSGCVAVWIEAAPAQSSASADDTGEAASSAVHCRLAPSLETAAGLPAVLALTSQSQTGVIAVPLIYIGLDDGGDNYVAKVRDGSGSFVERQVVVGATDGVRRVVTSGLKVGDVLTPVAQQ